MRVMAEGGNFDAIFRGCIQNTGSSPTTYVLSVNGETNLLQEYLLL
jgi:hypothetical protein